jgi:peptidoglycan/LPS O-acetylase OafA/YrhL
MLLTLWAARREPTSRALLSLILAWASLNVYIPHDLGMDPRLTAILNLAPLAVTLVLSVSALGAGRALIESRSSRDVGTVETVGA